MNKTLVAGAVGAALLVGGLTACGSSGYDDSDTQYVYVHGYYDHYHHYHTYSTPHRVTRYYYNHHRSSLPKPYKTVTVKKHTTGGTSYNRTTPKHVGKVIPTRKTGGSSYKKTTH